MSWFRRKDASEIPPVAKNNLDANRNELLGGRGAGQGRSTSPAPPSNFSKSSSNTYVASRDGDPYAARYQDRGYNDPKPNSYGNGPAPDQYPRRGVANDPYARSGGDVNADREQLFAGYNPERNAPSRRNYDEDPGMRTQEQEEEDTESIKRDIRFTKQETVSSSRNALKIAMEAEETARNTLLRLGDQSGIVPLLRFKVVLNLSPCRKNCQYRASSRHG